jgi:hypothetical protein
MHLGFQRILFRPPTARSLSSASDPGQGSDGALDLLGWSGHTSGLQQGVEMDTVKEAVGTLLRGLLSQ